MFHLCFIVLMSTLFNSLLKWNWHNFPDSTRLVVGNLAFFTHGASVLYPSSSFSPSHIVNTLIAERCTALHGVPTHFLEILEEITKRKQKGDTIDLSQLRWRVLIIRKRPSWFSNNLHFRTGVAAGSPIPIDLMRRLIDEMNLTELTNAYGMSMLHV